MKKTLRSMLALCLVLVLCIGLMPALEFTAAADEIKYNYNPYPVINKKQRGEYMVISTVEDLYTFASIVNGTTEEPVSYGNYWCARLAADLVINEDVLNPDGSLNTEKSLRSWVPIGTDSRPFMGVFDGDGHTISGLYCEDVKFPGDIGATGLFGDVGDLQCDDSGAYLVNMAVKNITVKDSFIKNGNNVGAVIGYLYAGKAINCHSVDNVCIGSSQVGGVIGHSGGLVCCDVYNCTNTGTVSGLNCVGGVIGDAIIPRYYCEISGCWNTGDVTGEYYVGGVIGQVKEGDGFEGSMISCYNTAVIKGKGYVGGIIGRSINSVSLEDCYNSGAVSADGSDNYVGGIVGMSQYNTIITDCSNTATISGAKTCQGGIAGYAQNGYISGCVNQGEIVWYKTDSIYSGEYFGGIVGEANGTDVTNCKNFAKVHGSNDVGGIVGHAYSGSSLTNCRNSGELVQGEYEVGGIAGGLSGGFIDDCHNSGSVTVAVGEVNSYYGITGGIVGDCFNAPISDCTNSGTISNDNASTGGIAGNISGYTSVRYADVTGCTNTGTVVSTNSYVGGIAGRMSALGIFAENRNSGSITGSSGVGGIAGDTDALDLWGDDVGPIVISHCYNEGTITATKYRAAGIIAGNYLELTLGDCTNTGTVSAGISNAGGIIGYNSVKADIGNCWNAGQISAAQSYAGGIIGRANKNTTLSDCYNTADISAATSHSGGILGFAGTGTGNTVSNCYSTGNVSGGANVGGVVGLTTDAAADSVKNTYYLAGAATGGINGADLAGSGVAMTAEQMASGEVAYLLNSGVTDGSQKWYQTCGTGLPALAGKTVYRQTNCAGDYVYTNENVEGGHSYEAVVTAPTCTEDGYTTYTCTVCGGSYVADPVAAVGHSYEAVVTAPACTEDGYTTYTCAACGDSYVGDVVSATGHKFVDGSCSGCGLTCEKHDYIRKVTNPTLTVNGYTTFTCSVCGYSYVENYTFPDVPSTLWSYKSIEFAVAKGYFSGYKSGNFGPTDNISRQDFVVVLARIAKVDLSKYAGRTGFPDVKAGDYYEAAVKWASSNGIVSGYQNGKFGVGDKITREQLVTILYRYAQKMGYDTTVSSNASSKLYKFGDAGKVTSYAKDAVIWALDKGVISGMTASTVGPQNNASRGQVATILMNIFTKNIMPF